MGQKRSPEDEQLVRSLYRKLDWMTFQAAEEEFDADQVKAILKLLDELDPLPERTEADLRKAARSRDGKHLGVVGGRSAGKERRQDASLSDPQAAFERFKRKYGISDEEMAGKGGTDNAPGPGKILPFSGETPEETSRETKDPKPDPESLPGAAADSGTMRGGRDGKPPFRRRLRKFFTGVPGKVAAGFLFVLCGITCLGIGTSAVQQKPFFEIVRDGVNSMKITVTGNTMESEPASEQVVYDETERVYYGSWDEVKEENPDIMTPGYIPEGLELEELYGKDYENSRIYTGVYDNKNTDVMYIRIKAFENDYEEAGIKRQGEWKVIELDDERGITYYNLDSDYLAEWKHGNCLYVVICNNISKIKELEQIVTSFN